MTACKWGEPPIQNAETDFDDDFAYVPGSTIEAECDDDSEWALLETVQTITCEETGWAAAIDCVKCEILFLVNNK